MGDGLPVPTQRVQPPPKPGLGCRRRGRKPEQPPAPRARDRPGECRGSVPPARPGGSAGPLRPHAPPHPTEAVEQVALHVQLPADIGLREPQLARRPQQPPQRLGATHHDRGNVGRGRVGAGAGLHLAAVPGPQTHRQPGGERDAREGREVVGHSGSGLTGGGARMRAHRLLGPSGAARRRRRRPVRARFVAGAAADGSRRPAAGRAPPYPH